MNRKHRIPLLLLLPASCAGLQAQPASSTTLRFDWPRHMHCIVEQSERRGDDRVEKSQFELAVTPDNDVHRVRIGSFRITGLDGNLSPAQRKQMAALGRIQLEKEFYVSLTGEFLRAESVEDARSRIQANESRDTRGVSMLALSAANSQERLNEKYRATWQSLAGGWIGLSMEPGKMQEVVLAPETQANVTVGEPRDCRDARAARCVVIIAETAVERFAPRTRFELEVEPATLLPHRWTERELMNSGDESSGQEYAILERERSFTCNAGNPPLPQ